MRTIKCQICGKEVEAKGPRQKYCPECKKAIDRARWKEYYENNKEKKLAKQKEYQENNKEKIAARKKECYENNKEKIAEYYDNNKGQIRARQKEYYEKNKVLADREGDNFCVYIHTDPIGKVYIGRAVGDNVKTVNRQRWQGGSGYQGQKFYDECIAVYGWDNIQHEIVEWGLTYEEVLEREQYWIERYNSRNPEYGYNVA